MTLGVDPRKAIESLSTKRAQNIMLRRFAFYDDQAWSFEALSEHYGISITEVKQIINSALKELGSVAE